VEAKIQETSDHIQISTPLYQILIKKSDWSLYLKASQASKYSKHQAAVLRLVEQLIDHGAREINADGITELPLNGNLSLACGQGRADVVYIQDGVTYFIEVETADRLGRQQTTEQLGKLASGSENLFLAVPIAAAAEAGRILRLIGLNRRIQVLPIE